MKKAAERMTIGTFDLRTERRPRGTAAVARWGAWLAAVLGVVLLTGCTATASREVIADHGDLAAELRGRELGAQQVVVPYLLDDELRRWAHDLAPPVLSSEQKLERLAEALTGDEELKLHYRWGYTGTAVEAFQERRANCLAFTYLFLGMAREVGVPVYFLAVETETFRRQGSFVVVSDHVAVGYGHGADATLFDFSDRDAEELRRVRRISDLTAIAMYHSNRGAEVLQEGRISEALHWLRTAVAIDPELGNGWVNLGVARRHQGDFAGAEEAYRRALEIDPRIYAAYENLATMLRLQERDEEAAEVELLLADSPTRNPYTYLTLGDVSFRNGRLEEARRLYRRAARLSGADAETYAALGQVALASGDFATARKMLEKARELGGETERIDRLATLLAVRTGRRSNV